MTSGYWPDTSLRPPEGLQPGARGAACERSKVAGHLSRYLPAAPFFLATPTQRNTAMQNPYLDWASELIDAPGDPGDPIDYAIKSADRMAGSLGTRRPYTRNFAWAVPTEEAVVAIAKHSPIVEIGAGTGYWAWCLRQVGAEVRAFDSTPPTPPADKPGNAFSVSRQWSLVEPGYPSILRCFPGHTLLLCWPPYDNPMAADCLREYRGDKLVYIGEGNGGCTGCDKFDERLDADWETCGCVSIPQWPGLHDCVQFFRRKSKPR